MKVLDVINQIQKEAIENTKKSEQRKRTRVINKIEIGQVIRQGDIYIIRVNDDHTIGDIVDNRQLVDGVSVGSRHVLVGDDISVYEGKALPYFFMTGFPVSYAFRIKTGAAVITHPEHDYIRIEVPGLYQVTQQMDARTKRAVID